MRYDITRFKTIEPIKGNATISITKNGMTFSQAAIQKLGKPEYIEILIDEEEKILAVIAKNEKSTNSFGFYSPGKKYLSVRIGNKDLKMQISSLMGWDLNNSNGYRIEGEFEKECNGMFFELTEAHPM